MRKSFIILVLWNDIHMQQLISFSKLFLLPLMAVFFVSAVSPSETYENENRVIIAESLGTSSHMTAYSALKGVIEIPALNYALRGYDLFSEGVREDVMIIIDFSLPSTEERFFAINPQTGELLYKKLVAHGQGTGNLYARNFSNKEGSHQSSLGFYRTAETYSGKHGLSLRLDGLQKGLNSAARERAIVIHSADYVSYDFISENGYLGRSWGCPALPSEDYENIISTIAEGTLLLIYHPQLSGVNGKI